MSRRNYFRIRKPSIKKRIAARLSLRRFVRDSLGIRAPRGFGIFFHPKRAISNRVYRRTSFDLVSAIRRLLGL